MLPNSQPHSRGKCHTTLCLSGTACTCMCIGGLSTMECSNAQLAHSRCGNRRPCLHAAPLPVPPGGPQEAGVKVWVVVVGMSGMQPGEHATRASQLPLRWVD